MQSPIVTLAKASPCINTLRLQLTDQIVNLCTIDFALLLTFVFFTAYESCLSLASYLASRD